MSRDGTLPDFFIAGNPKCGTTALYDMLLKHPQVFLPTVKEPNFFSSEWQKSSSPPESLDDYRRLFDAATSDQRIGEASAFYLSSSKAPEAIHATAALGPASSRSCASRPASCAHSIFSFSRATSRPSRTCGAL